MNKEIKQIWMQLVLLVPRSETLYDLSKRNKCKQIRMWILLIKQEVLFLLL